MTDNISQQFAGEIRSFFSLSLLNVVFAALLTAFGVIVTIVFGMEFIGTSMPALPEGDISIVFPVLKILFGVLAVVGGLRWMYTSMPIFSGIKELRDEYSGLEEPVSDETITGMIIRMISIYRENRETILYMINTSIFWGFYLLLLGITYSLEFISFSTSSGTFTVDALRVIPLASLAFFIAIVSLFSMAFFKKFKKYANVWDVRQQKIDRAEENLQHFLERE
jgi:hypothetical protein